MRKILLVVLCQMFCLWKVSEPVFSIGFGITGVAKKKVQDLDGSVVAAAVKIAPFQGPANPSFEKQSSVNPTSQPSNWTTQGVAYATTVVTGIMPTDGSYYMVLNSCPTAQPALCQDNVDLSASKQLIFDYTFIASGQNTTMSVVFAGNTVWSNTYTTSSSSPSARGETVTLPSLPTPGKLCIQLNTVQTVYLDNFRITLLPGWKQQ